MGFLRLFRRSGPKIKVHSSKKDGFSGWIKCSGCGETVHANELSSNHNCCPKCDYHYRLTVAQRIKLLFDKDSFREIFSHLKTKDTLGFVDLEAYPERVEKAKSKSGRDEAVCVGHAKIEGLDVAVGILDFSFMGGSMGSVVGERLTRMIEYACEEGLPVLIVSASGGARMQESILSLMQMAKTSAALGRLGKKGLPYISLVTNPTTGGVTASFASLGDVIIAEPGALFGFTGPRVIEQTIKQKLPENAQKSEFLQEKGMVDMVVHRKDLKATLATLVAFLKGSPEKREAEVSRETFMGAKLKKILGYAVGTSK